MELGTFRPRRVLACCWTACPEDPWPPTGHTYTSGPRLRGDESIPYGQKIRTARQVGQFMPLSVGSPRLVRYVVLGDQWRPLRTRGQMGELMEWARILAYISGTVDQELLLRNEYLAAENQILRGQLKGRPKLSDAERAKLGEIGRRLGRKALGDVATAA